MSMAHQAAAAGGDTRLTKLFVGGLAWETSKEGVRGHFERFGEILEAVVIADKGTGRSKGYGFVTFREAEAAMRACLDPYPVIDGRRANCNLACLGVQRSKAPQTLPYLQPCAAVGHVHGGGNINTRAMKAAIAAAGGGGASFVDHGIQQGVPAAAYNMYGYSPYFSDYSYQPLTYYQAYGGLAGGAQYQVFNGGATTAPTAGLAMADPTGLYPYYQYAPAVSAAAAYNMMQYPQMYQYAAVGAPPESSPTAVSGLHQFIGAAAFEPHTGSQAGGMTLAQLTAPALPAPAPQYQYRLVSPMPIATPDQKKPLA
ncbi:RNA-binding protein 24-like isoform X1 [Triticum dicoccoides]|uniref:RNA-binding protein 24-like isoform X1 n=1 Tax=Triticum dicoccoides TaxID=85692 RepID=UPI000E786FDD|nr:RNA-binding protein 24-like isoform X1 [Triticum dicoccoides]